MAREFLATKAELIGGKLSDVVQIVLSDLRLVSDALSAGKEDANSFVALPDLFALLSELAVKFADKLKKTVNRMEFSIGEWVLCQLSPRPMS